MTPQHFIRPIAAVAAAILCLPALAAGPHDGARAPRSMASAIPTDRLIVKYRSGEAAFPTARAEAALRVAANRQGVAAAPLRRMASGAHVFKLNRRLSPEEMTVLASHMKDGDPNVEYAEPDRLLQPSYIPVDALYGQQWSLSDPSSGIRAPAAWDRSRGTGVVVAVIDTGVRPHADLVGNLLPGYDFITEPAIAGDGGGRDADATDPGDAVAAGYCGTGSAAQNSSWHGTHVAGIVAAQGNTAGITGVAFGAKVQPVRVLGRCGGYLSDIADALTWSSGGSVAGVPANPTPARVLNLSLGGTGLCGTTMQNAITAARGRGAVVVVAAGNEGRDTSQSTPANCTGVVAVAATVRTGGKAWYSNTGAQVALAAPGGDSQGAILSTLNSGTTGPGLDNYAGYIGTSMATPAVSGVAALMLSVNPKLTPDQLGSLLKTSATPFPAPCAGCGSGIVNADAAVRAAAGTAPAPSPTPTPTPAPTPAPTPTVTTVAEKEPNNTIATAQALATGQLIVNGSLVSADNDFYRVSLPARQKLVVTVTPSSQTAAALGAYLSSGQPLLVLGGSPGGIRQITVTNSGSTAVVLAVRVAYAGGSTGTYKLSLAP